MGAGTGYGADLAVVHDQIGELGGTERVVAAVLDRYPEAQVIAPVFDANGYPPTPWASRARVVRGGRQRHHFLLPLYARRLATEPLDGARVVLTFPGAGWSLAAAVPSGARHVCYSAGVPPWLNGDAAPYLLDYPAALRPLVQATLPGLRRHYGRLLHRPHRLLTNSSFSAEKTQQLYGRSSEVLHPPVRTSFFTPDDRPRRHVLAVARLVRHKRIDVVVEAFRGLEETLVVVGGGPQLERLRLSAPSNVRFTGVVDDHELRELYRASRAVVVPSVEEFGIVMAEAQACGVPVIAPRAGGALEVIRDGETGLLLDRADPASIEAAGRALASRRFSAEACRASAERFSEQRFIEAIARVIDEEMARARRAAVRPGRPRLPGENDLLR